MTVGLSNSKYRGFARAGIAVLLCSPGPSFGIDLLELEVAKLGGPDWSASDIRTELELADGGIRATLAISELRIAGLEEPAREVRFYCPKLDISATHLGCEATAISGHYPYLERQRLSGALRYGRADGTLEWRIDGVAFAEGQLAIDGELSSSGWRLHLAGRNVDAAELLGEIDAIWGSNQGITLAGRLSFGLAIAGGQAAPTIEGSVEMAAVQASNAEGTVASDALAGTVKGKLEPAGSDWNFDLALEPVSGQLYIEPVFLDVDSSPFSLNLAGSWAVASGVVAIDSFAYRQGHVGEVAGSMRVELKPEWVVTDMDAAIRNAQLPLAYDIYLAPYLFGTELDALESAGSFDADLLVREADLSMLRARLEQVHLDDENERFAIYGLSGQLEWQVIDEPGPKPTSPSRLRWDGGFVYGVEMGSGEIDFLTQDQDFALLQAVRLPVLDGGLMIHVLEIAQLGAPDMRIEFDARIDPISLQALTTALGWPVFGGTLSGTLPRLTYELGELTLGGNLVAKVFDGEISVEKLKITEPFGLVPQLAANIIVRSINLEKATETFSFGKITGLLDGQIRDLHMLDWTPTAFDAKFQTPESDRSRRRISQRAIENISSLSGQSVTAVLSSGFLRFFDDFAYDRIAISCRLKNDVCATGALLPEGERYYIVKGKGVPRIDVIGYSRRVAWRELIDRLKSIHYDEAVID